MTARRDACVVAAVGSPLTGKGLFAQEWLTRSSGTADRIRLVWSAVERTDNYGGLLGVGPVSSIPALVDLLKRGARAAVYFPTDDPPIAVRGRPLDKGEWWALQFDRFCRIAWACPGAAVVVEELSRVTSPSWSPPAWRNICTSGSHVGLAVLGTVQRASRVDKDFFDACTEIRCYRQNRAADAEAVAGEIPGAEPAEIQALPDRHFLHYRRGAPLERGVQLIAGEKEKRRPRTARPR